MMWVMSNGLDTGGIAGLIAAAGTAITGIIVSASGLMGKRNTVRQEELQRCEKHADEVEHQNLLLELWAFQLQQQLVQHGHTPVDRPTIEPRPTGSAS